ncbi:hypothetical protein NC653_037501 [Populus alba x Populus x berolinensis]|uniref:Uncharacterized protein n=1 Tax=Populus alba x Populus x berolinensis TaxID=444605 RepID=A0AAD6LEN4_9ROSI|nr:hypothetical protein NC653_037501 [Populus alba x Populus x berolinensis]
MVERGTSKQCNMEFASSTPVVQLGTVTRTSARLRNVQPDVNLDQSYEALKRQKKNAEATQAEYSRSNY